MEAWLKSQDMKITQKSVHLLGMTLVRLPEAICILPHIPSQINIKPLLTALKQPLKVFIKQTPLHFFYSQEKLTHDLSTNQRIILIAKPHAELRKKIHSAI
jgi:hypothetical protein